MAEPSTPFRRSSLDDPIGAPIRTLAMDQSDWARHGSSMDEALIGYARCSTDEQDLTAQRQALHALGVPPDRVYIDHGISGTKRERPGLDQALAAVRTGDTLVVPKLDRLARSVPDARDIGDTLAKRGVSLSLGGQIYDPDDPMGKLFFNILATFAEFEVDLIRMRTREGMAVARAQGKLKGRQPKLSPMQQRELKRMHQTGEYTISDLGELFSVSRPTVYRTISRTNA
jgi:DNA invertase Pin-like site-specific DNA recombinase